MSYGQYPGHALKGLRSYDSSRRFHKKIPIQNPIFILFVALLGPTVHDIERSSCSFMVFTYEPWSKLLTRGGYIGIIQDPYQRATRLFL